MAESVTLGWTNHGPEPGDMNSDLDAIIDNLTQGEPDGVQPDRTTSPPVE